jgi:hypothetical protein
MRKAKLLDRSCRVVRTTRLETTRGPQQRRYGDLVKTQQPQGGLGSEVIHRNSAVARPPLRTLSPRISASRATEISEPESSRALRRAITTMSDPAGNLSRASRNHSLIQRFTRFRTTEFPTRLLTVTPNLRRFSSDSSVRMAVTMTKPSKARRLPDFITRPKSSVLKIRSACRKRPVFENTALLRGDCDCEAFSALRATALQDCTPRTRLHSRAKSMNSFPANAAGLVGSFHRRPSIFILSRVRGVRSGFPSGIRFRRRSVSKLPLILRGGSVAIA